MPAQEQKAAPRVHRVQPKPSQEGSADGSTEPSVAVAVPLDSLEDKSGSTSEKSLEDVDIEEEVTSEDHQESEDDDDADLSLLDGDEKPKPTIQQKEEPEEGFLEVFSEDCLQCRSLVPFAKKKFKGCHFSSGNKHCPASQTQVVIRVPLEEIVPRFIRAEKANDFSRLARLNAKLAEKPDWYQARVAQALREARLKQS